MVPEAEDLALPRGNGRWLDRVARKVVTSAAQGDMHAARLIADHLDGKPKVEAEVNVNHGLTAHFLAAVRAANAPRQISDAKAEIIDLTPEKVEAAD